MYDRLLLWKFIPETLRPYWRHELRSSSWTQRNDNPYPFIRSDDTKHDMTDVANRQAIEKELKKEPASYFVDRTADVRGFRDDIESRELKRLLTCLRAEDGRKPIILPDVLCPWGCTEFCFEARHCQMALLIQNHLRKVVLNMPNSSYYKNLHLVETSRWDYLRGQESPYELSSPSGARSDEGAEEGPKDDYTLSNAEDAKHYDRILLNDNWRIRPGVILIANKGLMVMTCRHHESYNTMKRLYPHPPRKPYHNLSSSFSNGLCHAKLVPRGATPVKAHKYNNSFSM